MATEADPTEGADLAVMSSRSPTMRDIADELGVSRPLVSMVLRGVDGPSTESRDRILAAARAMGYRPNASARLLRRERSRTLGAVFTMRNPFQVRVIEQLFSKAALAGYGLALGPLTDDASRDTDAVIGRLLEERVEGIIAFNADQGSGEWADAVRRLPGVYIGQWLDEPTTDNVHVDDVEGLRLAVEHLVALGHRDIAYVGGSGGRAGRDRAESYRVAMHGVGLGRRAMTLESDFSEEGGAQAARQMLQHADRPSAIVCCSDQCATGVAVVLAQAGLRIPDDVSVVGFDDSYLASLSYLDLTSVHQDVDATVDAALACVLARLAGGTDSPKKVATPTRLAVRSSTGPVLPRATRS
jgi:DNA-binding LacI/PurR family transcriptional regulator